MEFNPNDLAHMDEMVKHSFGRKALIETATMKHEDNWQDVATPYDICGEMCDLVVGKADKYIVFFSLEFLEVLVFEKGIDPKNITFVGDFIIESGLASKMYGVNIVTITKNDVIKNGKFSNDIFTFLAIDKQKEINNSESDMKFNKVAVLGNPPYQISDGKQAGGKGASATPIYNKFIEVIIDSINPDYFSMIVPSRWMIGGKGLDSFRERMINDRHMKIIKDDMSCNGIFPTVDIAGGVCYFLYEKEHDGKCEFNGVERFLNEEDIIIRENEARSILTKVKNNSSKFVGMVASVRKPYGFDTDATITQSGVPCWFKQSIGKAFVDPSIVKDPRGDIGKWKVITPFAPIAGQTDFTKPIKFFNDNNVIIAEPNEVCTETYLVINSFNTKNEAENFATYMKTKFFRFMLRMRVVSQNITRDCYNWVPCVQDYSAPWTDAELYKKFNLTRQEVAYIESKIKAI